MKFEDWYNASEWREGDHPVSVADAAWEHQAERIKELESQIDKMFKLLLDSAVVTHAEIRVCFVVDGDGTSFDPDLVKDKRMEG